MNPQFVKFSGATFERNGAHFRITGMKGDVLYAEGDDDAILSINPSELRLLEACGKLAWAQGEKPLIHNSTSETVRLHLSETKQLVLATVACRKNSLSWKETIEHFETHFPTFRHVGIRRLQQLIKSYEAEGIGVPLLQKSADRLASPFLRYLMPRVRSWLGRAH
ncbi:hypothetical protein QQG91_09860 [Marivivens sp. LCG002]|uniref:hypothetical protein n=1 Tax=Marivivens sp. LCG002 TaxID=3051171 RepID=UPI002555EA06|nr:hypothetical protein [Marivivens sp. LCG002]WIV49974.1 hypothetical protein QQG91_09860 [Marivivens sp. LCG002]